MNLTELLRCCIGGVNIRVRCESRLMSGLANAKRRMADFPASGPADFELTILLSKLNTRSAGIKHSDQIPVRDLLRLLPPRKVEAPEGTRLAQRLKRLGKDLLPIDLHYKLSARRSEFSLIPFQTGFMLADTNERNALLILDRAFQPPLTTGHTSWRVSADVTVLNSIMALLALYLAEQGGVVAHGVGVSRGEQGYVFLAPSKGGKTTLSAQSPPGAVLADDGVILRETGEGYRLYPTPFRQRPGGEIISWDWRSKPVPLRALFILGHGREVRVTPIPRPKLLGLLVGSYTHFYLWMDKRRAGLVFDFWRRISLNLPTALMGWRPGTDFWPEVEKFLTQGGIRHAFKERQKHLAQGI